MQIGLAKTSASCKIPMGKKVENLRLRPEQLKNGPNKIHQEGSGIKPKKKLSRRRDHKNVPRPDVSPEIGGREGKVPGEHETQH